MGHATDQPPGEHSPALQPNRILAEPATPTTCAQDLHTPNAQRVAAGEARGQLAEARMRYAS